MVQSDILDDSNEVCRTFDVDTAIQCMVVETWLAGMNATCLSGIMANPLRYYGSLRCGVTVVASD